MISVGLAPDGLRLALHSGHGIEDNNASVQYTEAALDLDREVYVAGRVDDVDREVLPGRGRRRGGDGDSPLPLLRHPVHDGSTGIDLADLVSDPRVIEDPLGDGRLTGVDVRDDTNIAHPFAGHTCFRSACCLNHLPLPGAGTNYPWPFRARDYQR